MNKTVAAVVAVVAVLIAIPLLPHVIPERKAQEAGAGRADHIQPATTPDPDPLRAALEKTVTVDIESSPEGGRLSVQYAVMEVCNAAGITYQWEKSRQLAAGYCQRFVEPVHLHNVTVEDALTQILKTVGGRYDIDVAGLYLK